MLSIWNSQFVFCVLLGLLMIAEAGLAAESSCSIQVADLSCDHAVNPIAVDHRNPVLGWILRSSQRGSRQSAYQILVSRDLDSLRRGIGDLWDSGKVESDHFTDLVYGGTPPGSGERCYWQVRVWDELDRASSWSEPGYWQVGLLEESDWHAQWIAAAPGEKAAAPLFRREFSLPGKIERATAYVYGLGWYEFYLNGSKVGDQVLAPPNSHYDRVNLYDTYDVTELLRQNGNAVGVMLGGGYDSTYSRWGWKWERSKRFILQIQIDLADGSHQEIVSDQQWRSHAGPITACGIYSGERYDARKEQSGWSTFGFADEDWSPVIQTDSPGGHLVANTMPPIRVAQTLAPISITEPRPGVFVVDFGQNFAGWVRIRMQGQPGDSVKLHHSELIDSTGMIDPWTNRQAQATDITIFKGNGIESYEPRFSYHGFRYVEITGLREKPTAEMVEGRVVHADFATEGSFSCSDATLNRVAQNFRWSMTSNFMSIPTDCPMRDERTPCAMDSRVYEEGAIYLFPLYRYYRKWLRDIRGGNGNPDWDGDQVLLPWRLYFYTGDIAILRENYDAMKKYVDGVADRTPDLIYRNGFGDWCAPNSGTWESYFSNVTAVNTALFFQCAETVANTASILNDQTACEKYRTLADSIRFAYNAAFFHPERNTYGNGSQTEDILPLALNIAPLEKREQIAEHLVNTILIDNGGHLDTGITGTRYICDVLCDQGYGDLALQIFTQDSYPGFGHQIKLGATTTWEQWYAKGEMNSHNHAMFSGPMATLFSRFGGVQPLEAGFRRFIVKPAVIDSLDWVQVIIETVRGRLQSKWQRQGKTFSLQVEVPVGAQADVHIPLARAGAVFESGRPAAEAVGVQYLGEDAQNRLYRVGSGVYRFSTRQ
ncbi:MAG TPA: family 78 glycoside hydrolase catalytic domain [bacterium]|nr:family 78 glycoside hydrolase catalytic domain [bacterium]HPG45898.1 family 78 glycoside hydrolase catalytic domain [bacterium]HPM97720.1 family 78 glycoside hydrolase catalytic domain [bacterium]